MTWLKQLVRKNRIQQSFIDLCIQAILQPSINNSQQHGLIYMFGSIIIIQESLIRMKKFLDLKRSIVNSKNEPTIIQTYLESIRSSCYKISTPKVSPRTSELSTSVTAQNSGGSNSIQRVDTPVRALDHLSVFKQKSSEKRQTQALSLPQIHKIEQVFSTLSSHCKKANPTAGASQQQIFETILKSLDLLAAKQQFKQSVILIRNIVSTMSGGKIGHQTIFANHCLQSNRDNYIKQCAIEDYESYREHSHFKSCLKTLENQQDNYLYGQNHANKNYVTTQLRWNEQSKSHSQSTMMKQHEKFNHHDGSIYIEDTNKSEDDCSDVTDPEATLTERRSTTDPQGEINSMHSQWREEQLQCIEEVEEEDLKSSSKISIIPQETIQFKKILYMLDSSTAKKQGGINSNQQPEQIEELQKICHKVSHHSTKSLFCEKTSFLSSESEMSNSHNDIYQTYSHEQPANSPQQQKSPPTYVQILHERQNRRCQHIVADKKQVNHQSQKQKNKIPNAGSQKLDKKTGSNKPKQLNEIVSMLNNKYNRTVKLGANR